MVKRSIVKAVVITASVLLLSSCTDAYEERGLCSYFGACEYGLGAELDNINYCKDLGSCSDPSDPTEYTISGKPTKSSGGGVVDDSSE